MTSNKLIIFNIISFQTLWFACVLSAKPGLSLPVLMLVLFYTAAHLQWIEGWHQALPLLLTALTGCLLDQTGYAMGWVNFAHHQTWSSYLPLWMIALWLSFACTLNVSLRWLQFRPWLAAILGGLLGPLAYMGAAALEAVVLPSPYSLAWLAIEWAVAMPLLLWIRQAFNHTAYHHHMHKGLA
jgi:hypothetical protein